MSPEAGQRAGTPSQVLGIALGLLLLLGVTAALFQRQERALEPAGVLAELFEPAPLPAGLEATSAARLSSGERVVRIIAPQAPPEAPRVQIEPPPPGQPSEGPRIDWANLPEGAKDTLPIEVLVLAYPRERAASELKRLFASEGGPMPYGGGPGGGPQPMPGGGGGPGGPGKRVVDRGTLPWGPYAAEYAHERELEEGGTFVDRLRINVSVEGRYAALFLRWPRGLPASKPRAEELLATLQPRAQP